MPTETEFENEKKDIHFSFQNQNKIEFEMRNGSRNGLDS